MRDLIFCTSNSTKLSHARYLMEGQPARIKGFRQHTYHANYEEPRVASREELLKASYENALRQFARARISTDTNPFILEDTSVRIDALSTDGEDRPGLDIKFWMQDPGPDVRRP